MVDVYKRQGHGISDTDTGELLDISGGELYQAQIVSVLKGTKGNPGELSGYIDYDDSKKIGTIDVNKMCIRDSENGELSEF